MQLTIVVEYQLYREPSPADYAPYKSNPPIKSPQPVTSIEIHPVIKLDQQGHPGPEN